MYSAFHSNDYLVNVLLSYKTNVNATDANERTAFHFACCSNNAATLALLNKKNHKLVNFKDNNGMAALHYAVLNSSS